MTQYRKLCSHLNVESANSITSVIIQCVRGGDRELLKRLVTHLEEGLGTPEIINELDEEGMSPLHLAVRANNPDAMEILLIQGGAGT